jgi:predicted nucleic acid-binding Zn ribbon protein
MRSAKSGGRTGKGGRRTGRRRNDRGEATLADLITRFMSSAPADAVVMRLGAAWERALPARIVRASSPVKLVRDVLYVHTTTSAWAQELTLMQNDVLARLKRVMPDLAITSLRARAGAFPKRAPVRVQRPPVVVPLAESELPGSVRSELDRIEDPRLRDVISGAARMSLSRTRTS